MQLKQARYHELADECRATYKTTVLTAEVGTRVAFWRRELSKPFSNSAYGLENCTVILAALLYALAMHLHQPEQPGMGVGCASAAGFKAL